MYLGPEGLVAQLPTNDWDVFLGQEFSFKFNNDAAQPSTQITLFVNCKFTITYLSIKTSKEIAIRHRNTASLRAFEKARVDNSEGTRITVNATDQLRLGKGSHNTVNLKAHRTYYTKGRRRTAARPWGGVVFAVSNTW